VLTHNLASRGAGYHLHLKNQRTFAFDEGNHVSYLVSRDIRRLTDQSSGDGPLKQLQD
jgi:hypothetical protein